MRFRASGHYDTNIAIMSDRENKYAGTAVSVFRDKSGKRSVRSDDEESIEAGKIYIYIYIHTHTHTHTYTYTHTHIYIYINYCGQDIVTVSASICEKNRSDISTYDISRTLIHESPK